MPHSKGYWRRDEGRSGDVVPIGAVVDDLLAQDVFSRGPQIVGERLSKETAPLSLEDGTLVVGATNGPWGAQAKFLHAEILKRADEALGGGAVRTLRIVV